MSGDANHDTAGIGCWQPFRLRFGPEDAGWRPLAGDWDGDGDDSIGLFDPEHGMVYLRNEPAAGIADIRFRYGPVERDAWPLSGDWDGDGLDTIGLYVPEPEIIYLRDSHTAGFAEYPDAGGFTVDALLAVLQQRADGWAQANEAPLLVAAADPSDGSPDRLAEAFDPLLDVTPPPDLPTGFEFL